MNIGKSLASIAIAMLLVVSSVAPAIASISPPTLEATLAPGESVTETKTVTIPALPPKADVVFAFDLTGSMVGIIDTAKANGINITNNLSALGIDINYGVMSYMDYPHSYDSYGYSAMYGDPASGDYAYALNQSITSDTTAVSNAINGLVLGYGADGPQDYTRTLYESYADTSVGWRTGAKKVLVNFGDNVPHDNNLNEGITTGTWSTGGDPGRDEVMFTADDLDLQAVLANMTANNVVLLESHTQNFPAEWMGGPIGFMVLDYWNNWTAITGGKTFITDSPTLVDDVVDNITAVLTTPTVSNLHLEASSGYESWLTSVTPPSYSGPTGVSVNFDLTITVPMGTPDGTYTFTISAVDDAGVSYGEQSVTITVVSAVAEGNMTGGGSVFTNDNRRVTHGFELNCDASKTPNNLQINWGKSNKFHLESLSTASCTDDPAIMPNPPTASFDTYEGTGMGRYNGMAGATAHWKFTDAGEPGRNDYATIQVWDSGGALVLDVSGYLMNGNHQAHDG